MFAKILDIIITGRTQRCGGNPYMVRLSGSLLPSDVGGMVGVGTMGMLGSKGTVVEPYWGVHGKIARY